MKAVERLSSDTFASGLTRFGCAAGVAALASTGNLIEGPDLARKSLPVSMMSELEASFTSAKEAKFPAAADTGAKGLSSWELAEMVKDYLAKRGFTADRSSITGDGSQLLQFFGGFDGIQSGVDIFPNGELVVIVRKAGMNQIFEVAPNELERVATLLTNGGSPT